MDENEVVEQVDITEDDWDAFDDGFGDDQDIEDESVEESEGQESEEEVAEDDGQEDTESEDEPEESTNEPESEAEEPREATDEGNQLFEITHLGKTEKVTLKEMKELAQKGKDYDHVREERDNLRNVNSGNKDQMDFLQELAKRSGLSVEEQIDRTRALWLMDSEADKGNDLTEAEALRRVQRARKSKGSAPSGQEEAPQSELKLDEFLEAYPNVKANDIPQEVWDQAHKWHGDLRGAYQAWEIKQLKAEKAEAKKEKENTKNKERSTGSRQTAGSASAKRDPFDEGWDS